MLISFVIPCYRSASTIGHIVKEIENTMMQHREFGHEIILVNDCSPDNTFEVIKELAQNYESVIGIDISKNRGQQCAIMAGMRHSQGDLIVSCDDDGQTPIETVFQLIEKMEIDNHDVVCGKYVDRGKRSLFRKLGTAANRKMAEVFLEKPKNLFPSVYFVAKRFVIEEIIKYENPYPYMVGLLLRTTANIGNVEVTQKKRLEGKSGYTIKKLISLWVNGFTTFSIKPLRFATFIGAILGIIGFIIITALVVQKFINPNISIGWTSLIATNILIGGIVLVVLGMIGEYVGRIYLSINQTPQYVVRTIVKGGKDYSI